MSLDAAATYLGDDNVPTRLLVRVDPDQVDSVTAVLAATANPINPEEVEVDRPTNALEAADDALTALFLGLGAVALVVGGVGIANVMVISALERRSEIGLHRALGATRRMVAGQSLGEALLLATIGGVGRVLLGTLVTVVLANLRGRTALIPPVAIFGGIVAALVIGAVCGSPSSDASSTAFSHRSSSHNLSRARRWRVRSYGSSPSTGFGRTVYPLQKWKECFLSDQVIHPEHQDSECSVFVPSLE